MEQLAKIYKMHNNINNQIYIGQTTLSLEERMESHFKRVRDETDIRPLYVDIRKQGIESFNIEVIDECFERHKFVVEEHWYNHYFDKGYAMYDIKIGAKHSRNTRQRMAEIRHTNHKVDYSSEEFKHRMSEKTSGENNGMFNKKDDTAVNGRMVIAYDQEGSIAHEFVSVKVALQFLNVTGHSTLNRACRTGELYKGFHWKKEWINR